MEIGLQIPKRTYDFAVAFYHAAKAYYYHRFNIKAGPSYFLDALHYHYRSGTATSLAISTYDDVIEYLCSNVGAFISEFNFRGRTLSMRILEKDYPGQYCLPVSNEQFILHLGSRQSSRNIPFPPIRNFIEFPVRGYRFNFTEDLFKVHYPNAVDFALLSYDIHFLRRWLLDKSVDINLKIVFILGYNSGISGTLSLFLMDEMVRFNPKIEKYCYYIDEIHHDELLAFFRTGQITEDMQPYYGNYSIRPVNYDILYVTSDLKFVNAIPKILPGEPLPFAESESPIVGRYLGKGSYGKVYLTSDPNFVIKVFEDEEYFDYEIQSLNLIRRYLSEYTNIAQILSFDPEKMILRMPRLFPLQLGVNPFVPEKSKVPLFLQMVRGLYSLHSSGLAHNDIKPENVMLNSAGEIELIDFGLVYSFYINPDETNIGTPMYRGPEDFDEEFTYDGPEIKLMPAHDIWSTVITCYEMLLGYTLYSRFKGHSLSNETIVENISMLFGNSSSNVSNGFIGIPKLFDLVTDPDLVAILRRCVDPNPFTRATSEEILRSPYANRFLKLPAQTITSYQRFTTIDGNAFAGYRDRKERENWIVFCKHFDIIGVEYAPIFESRDLPKSLCYMDYFAILLTIDEYEFKFVQLPHPVPVFTAVPFNLQARAKRFHRDLMGIPRLQIFKEHRRYQEIEKIVTRGYLDGKCEYMSVLELLSE